MLSQEKRPRDHLWAIIGLVAVSIVMAIIIPTEFARRTDLQATHREENLVVDGLTQSVRTITERVTARAVSDDALVNLGSRFDSKWARANLGAYLRDFGKVSFSYVLDGQNDPIYAMAERNIDPDRYSQIAPVASVLVATVRERERLENSDDPSNLGATISLGDYSIIDGKLFIATATLVQAAQRSVHTHPRPAPIIITLTPIDAAWILEFANRQHLQNARLMGANYAAPASIHSFDATVPIKNKAGKTLAVLKWRSSSPGDEVGRGMLPFTSTIALVILISAFVIFRRARRLAISLREGEARATHMAFHDSMTGLANRARLEQALSMALATYRRGGETFAVHCIDLDRFKELNDTYGHQAGDELLKMVASRLKSLTRGADVTARLGGDEFAIVQIGATAGEAERLGNAIVKALAEPFEMTVGVKRIGASVGVTMASEGVADALEYVRQADMALYRAKGAGRGQYCMFRIEMDAANRIRRLLQEDLRAGLGTDQLRMVYQPQVNKSGKVVGVEALLRWTHPERGAVSPAVFIPLAEESGLMIDLGEYVLRQVFRDSAAWPGLKVAVNVSATQIQSTDFAKRLEQIVREEKVDPERFELELTESVLLGDDEAILSTLTKLREMGFSLALDDFGTGYSSLSYLRRFPITKIKIDRSFVSNLGVETEADAVVSAIVRLARALSLSVIAEGVETTDQWLHLQRAGCAEIQGFVAHRPMETATLTQMLSPVSARASAA